MLLYTHLYVVAYLIRLAHKTNLTGLNICRARCISTFDYENIFWKAVTLTDL